MPLSFFVFLFNFNFILNSNSLSSKRYSSCKRSTAVFDRHRFAYNQYTNSIVAFFKFKIMFFVNSLVCNATHLNEKRSIRAYSLIFSFSLTYLVPKTTSAFPVVLYMVHKHIRNGCIKFIKICKGAYHCNFLYGLVSCEYLTFSPLVKNQTKSRNYRQIFAHFNAFDCISIIPFA